jgi:hypothetical protein
VKSVVASRRAQRLGALSVSMAAGYATNASPIELTLSLTGESIPYRYPTVLNTANPAKKLNPQFPKAILRELPMMGVLGGL